MGFIENKLRLPLGAQHDKNLRKNSIGIAANTVKSFFSQKQNVKKNRIDKCQYGLDLM
jgi:hypothetical protein